MSHADVFSNKSGAIDVTGGEYAHDAVPDHLINEIKRGNCVAFVGAGFVVPAGLPRWGELLSGCVDAATAAGLLQPENPAHQELIAHIRRLLTAATSETFDRAAQTLADVLGSLKLDEMIARQLEIHGLTPQMRRRLELLDQIPFRAILTTNYDRLLPGYTPFNPDRPFRDVLRPRDDDAEASPYTLDRYEEEIYAMIGTATATAPGIAVAGDDEKDAGVARDPTATPHGVPNFKVPIIQLHGSISETGTIVCTRSGYRRLLYSAPAYTQFITSLMATCTILYMGFSFTDSYLNETRSAVLSMLDWAGHHRLSMQSKTAAQPPIAYAIINDQSAVDKDFLRRHEGVHVLTWKTHGSDWMGLDRYLENLHERSSVHMQIGKMLHGKRILFNDPMKFSFFVAAYCRECVRRVEECQHRKRADISRSELDAASLDRGDPRDRKDAYTPLLSRDYVVSAQDAVLDTTSQAEGPAAAPEGEAPHVRIDLTTDAGEALRLVRERPLEAPYDIIVTNYGARPDGSAELFDFMDALHMQPLQRRAPVIVFSSPDNAHRRRRLVMKAGATAYCWTIGGLIASFEQVLSYDGT